MPGPLLIPLFLFLISFVPYHLFFSSNFYFRSVNENIVCVQETNQSRDVCVLPAPRFPWLDVNSCLFLLSFEGFFSAF